MGNIQKAVPKRQEVVNRRLAQKSLKLGGKFDKFVFRYPKILDKIPNHSIIVILPKDDPELAEYNMKISKMNQEPGQPMVLVRTEKSRFEMEVIKYTPRNREIRKTYYSSFPL